MTTHPTCDDPGATVDRGSREGHRGHNPFFFANNSRQHGDIDTQIFPNDLARQAAWKDMNIDLLKS